MALKKKYAKKEDVPVAALGAYVEKNGEWVRDDEEETVPPPTGNDRLEEFRTANVTLRQANESLQRDLDAIRTQFKGIDPAKAALATDAINKITQEEERSLIAAGKFDEVITRRTAAALAELNGKITAKDNALADANAEKERLRSSLGKVLIERDMQIVLANKGLRLRKGALDDAIARTNRVWQINSDGRQVAMEVGSDGKPKPRYNGKGTELTMDDFVMKDLLEDASHLFETGTGGGSPGSRTEMQSPDGIPRFAKGAQLTREQIKMVAEGKAKVV